MVAWTGVDRRVALVAVDAQWRDPNGTFFSFSYGIEKLRAAIVSAPDLADTEVLLLDLRSGDPEAYFAAIAAFRPTFVGLSTYIWSLEVFAGQLERYDDLPLGIDDLHAVSSLHNDAFCDGGRRFAWRDNEPVFNFGRLRGKSLRWVAGDPTERTYLRWMVDGQFEEDAKDLVREALRGRIRSRLALVRARA